MSDAHSIERCDQRNPQHQLSSATTVVAVGCVGAKLETTIAERMVALLGLKRSVLTTEMGVSLSSA